MEMVLTKTGRPRMGQTRMDHLTRTDHHPRMGHTKTGQTRMVHHRMGLHLTDQRDHHPMDLMVHLPMGQRGHRQTDRTDHHRMGLRDHHLTDLMVHLRTGHRRTGLMDRHQMDHLRLKRLRQSQHRL